MTSLTPTTERLTRYVDDDLSPQERAAFEAELAADAALAAEVAEQLELRALFGRVPEALDFDSAEGPGDLAFERSRRAVMAAIGVAPEAARAATPAGSSRAARSSDDAGRQRTRRTTYGALVGLAAAAAVAVVAIGRGPLGPAGGANTAATEAPASRTEIVNVEFGKISGTYWEQTVGDDTVAIVWIDDTVLEEVGRP